MNTQTINKLREKYQTAKLTTYKEMRELHLKIGDNKFFAILTADQIVFYRNTRDNERYKELAEADSDA
jgi:phage antirepressor YoqD-like protein